MRFLQHYKNLWPGMAALFLLVFLRMGYTHTWRFAFLFWNFFLAVLPLYFSYRVRTGAGGAQRAAFALLWLLFFPNAAYLFTDIVHLSPGTSMRYWLDLVILFSSGVYGLIMTICSLRDMEGWYRRLVAPKAGIIVTLILLCACGYGIYLGRVERWNSWDVVAQPDDLLRAICRHLLHPFRYREAWLMTALFATCLQIVYTLSGYMLSGRRHYGRDAR